MMWLAQLVSLAGAAFNIFSYQLKENRRLFLCKGISGALFAVNFFMLGNITAAALNLVNLFRGGILAAGERFHKIRWLIAVQGLYVLCFVLTFGKSRAAIGGAVLGMILSVLATLVQLFETAVLWRGNGKTIRLAQLSAISPFWLVNNALTASVGGVITEVIGITSVVVSLIRFRKSGFDGEEK